MSNRIVAVLAVAYAAGCGLQFNRFDPPADAASDDSARGDSGAIDAAEPEVAAGDSASDATPTSDAGTQDGSDAGSADGPACGASGEPCCPGHMCQQGLVCRGGTCHP